MTETRKSIICLSGQRRSLIEERRRLQQDADDLGRQIDRLWEEIKDLKDQALEEQEEEG